MYLKLPIFTTFRRYQVAYQNLRRSYFINLVELKSPLFLPNANNLGMKIKLIILLDILRSKFHLSSVAQHVSIDNAFLDPSTEKFWLHWLKTLHSLVLPVQTHSTFTIMIRQPFAVCKWSSAPCRATQNWTLFSLWSYQCLWILFSSTSVHHDYRAHMITFEMCTKGFHVPWVWPHTWQRGWQKTYKPASSSNSADWCTL